MLRQGLLILVLSGGAIAAPLELLEPQGNPAVVTREVVNLALRTAPGASATVGGVNAVSGEPWEARLSDAPQNYLVCPNQPWLDGVNAGEGFVRQFVALPLGSGATVEGRLTGREEVGGIQIRVYEPKPGVFPDEPPPPAEELPVGRLRTPGLGLGAGGQIRQKLYPDPHGLDVWDPDNSATVLVQLLNSEQYRAVTGHDPPPPPSQRKLQLECDVVLGLFAGASPTFLQAP